MNPARSEGGPCRRKSLNIVKLPQTGGRRLEKRKPSLFSLLGRDSIGKHKSGIGYTFASRAFKRLFENRESRPILFL